MSASGMTAIRRFSRTGAVFFALVLAAVAVNLAAAVAMHRAGLQTGLWDLHFWLIYPGGHLPGWMPVDDSWMPMRKAYDWFAHPHRGTLYQQVFFAQHVKFQYPPSSLLLFAIPDVLHHPLTDRFLNWIGWLAVVAEMAAVGVLAHFALPSAASRPLRIAVGATAALSVLSFHSVLWAFSLGQIQTWLNACFALAALAYLTGRRRTAGAMIGFICLVKPQFGLFLVWALLRGDRRFLGGLLVVLVAGLALSLSWFGWANHVDYLSAISFMNRHGEAYYPNASVNGVLNRFIGGSDPFTVDKTAFPPFNPLIYYVSLATSLGLIALALFVRGRHPVFDFLAAGVAFTIASPIAWVHHLGVLPPVFAVLAVTLLMRTPERQTWIGAVVLLVAYLASAVFIPPLSGCAAGLPSLIYALPLCGALACIVLLQFVVGRNNVDAMYVDQTNHI